MEGWMDESIDGWWVNGCKDEWLNQWLWLQILLWLHVNIAAKTASTEAINSTATAISTSPDTAVTSAYASAKAGPLLAKWECLYCDSSRDLLWTIAWALGKSLGLRPRDFPWAPAIFHIISLLSSQYRYITVQYSAVQCVTVQDSAVQCSTVQYSAVQKFWRTVQYSAVHCSIILMVRVRHHCLAVSH